MYGSLYLAQSYLAQGYPGLSVGVPEWVSPSNHATGITPKPYYVFLIPQAANVLHFELQLDTANTFDTGNLLTVQSWAAQSGWEYYDGSAWLAIPQGGLDPAYGGNQVRYRATADLANGTWYRRVRARTKV
jgi:hypothetical protein